MLNAPEDILDQSFMNDVNQQMLKRAKDFGLDDLDVNISAVSYTHLTLPTILLV